MNGNGRRSISAPPDAVEELLGQAAPRPTPPAEVEREVRDAVHAEWQELTGKRRRRRRAAGFAAAATVLLAAVFGAMQLGDVESVRVASVARSFGSIHILGDSSELLVMRKPEQLAAGQTVVTGSESGIGLVWQRGGSLRIDQNSRVEFVSGERIRLLSGRVYFDSRPSELAAAAVGVSAPNSAGAGDAAFGIETPHGLVRHLGTQYMAYVDSERLAVSVREGRVSIEGRLYSGAAVAGQQLILAGGGRPSVANFNGYGEAWRWTEATAPAARLDGRTVHEFLEWICHETGLELHYASDAARQLAGSAELRGIVETQPRDALQLYEGSVDLDWRIEGGNVVVTTVEPGTGS